MAEFTVAQAVLIISGYALAAIRLLTASKPIWGTSAPARWATVIIPAVLVGVGAIPAALEGATAWIDVAVALVTAAGAGFAASRGPGPKPTPEEVLAEADKTSRINPGPPLLALLAAGVIGLSQQACSSAPPAPPCDPATLLAMNAECDAAAYQCGMAGTPEAECAAMIDCDRRFDERQEKCR